MVDEYEYKEKIMFKIGTEFRTINEAHTSQGLNGGTDGEGYIIPHLKSLLVIEPRLMEVMNHN